VVEALLETEAEQAEWQDHELELESSDDAQYDLSWEVWVCVLSSMDDPRDLCSFGLSCRLFQAITQTYSRSHSIAMQTSSILFLLTTLTCCARRGMVWRQLLGSTYGWVFDQWQAHMDLKQLGWRDAYRVCRKTACARVNVRRLFQKGCAGVVAWMAMSDPQCADCMCIGSPGHAPPIRHSTWAPRSAASLWTAQKW
jgi:hypothetical protein